MNHDVLITSRDIFCCITLVIRCNATILSLAKGHVYCTSGLDVDSTCTFSCSWGYRLTGSSTLTCNLKNGEAASWDENGTHPNCEKIKCPQPNTGLLNVNSSCSKSRHVGSICNYFCSSSDFRLSGGPSTRICAQSGNAASWIGSTPICEKIQCSTEPPAPSHGQVICTDNHNVNSKCTYSCKVGYQLIGSVIRRCNRSGDTANWDGSSSFCLSRQGILCDSSITPPANGNVFCSNGRDVNSTCTYTCSSGYQLTGESSQRTCNNTGSWSGSTPSCTPTTCSSALLSPNDGNVTCTNGQTVGSRCTFTCNIGYVISGGSTTRICALAGNWGVWTGSEPSCARITCPTQLTSPANGNVSCTSDEDVGSICMYSCSSGYRLHGGSSARTCTQKGSDAVWTGSMPTCRGMTCGSVLTRPDNGIVMCSNGANVGSRCSYTCTDGYVVSGASIKRMCAHAGNFGIWTGSEPTCIIIRCPAAPAAPLNGEVSCTADEDVGSQCTYFCNKGYQPAIIGSEIRTCIRSGDTASWDGSLMYCIRMECDSYVRQPVNGDVLCTRGKEVGSNCSYSCSDGYQLIGQTSIICQTSPLGTSCSWSGSAANCTRIQCEQPIEAPVNGNVACSSDREVGSICTYTCSPGYKHDGGSTSRTCQQEGTLATWTGSTAICTSIPCENPIFPPTNGDVSCTSGREVGSTCTYSCYEGFQLTGGSSTRNCTQSETSGTWTGSTSRCSKIGCQNSLSSLENGVVYCTSGQDLGSVCVHSCSLGYHLIGGSKIRKCSGSGTNISWTGAKPNCSELECRSALSSPSNGTTHCTNTKKVGSVCTFSCSSGYRLSGDSTRLCAHAGLMGIWTGSKPTCAQIQCSSRPSAPQHGSVVCTSNQDVGSQCTYSCSDGYRLGADSPDRTCIISGDTARWNGSSPYCYRIHCNSPTSPPSNGKVSCTRHNEVGSTCTYSCNTGYRLTGGSATRNCTQSNTIGEWIGAKPYCAKMVCSSTLPSPSNGEVSCTSSTDVDSVCTYSCGAGYRLDGGSSRVCRQSGNDGTQWSGSEPFCKEIQCTSPLSAPQHGSVTCTLNQDVGSRCTFSCSDGYRLGAGSQHRTCILSRDSARWNGTLAYCSRIQCDSPTTAPSNGKVSCTRHKEVGSTCTFSCNTGYRLTGGSPTRNCVQSKTIGEWIGAKPNCTKMVCSSTLPSPSNGEVSCTSHTDVGSVCTYSCGAGYRLDGGSTRVCTQSGNDATQWSGLAPVCKEIQCSSPLSAPQHGSVTCTSNQDVGSQCTFSCSDGYRLGTGSQHRTCILSRDSARWNGTLAYCSRIQCDSPTSAPSNGKVSCTRHNDVGSTCTYSCNTGYRLTGGSATRNCTQSKNTGEWIGAKPNCTKMVCSSALPSPSNGEVSCTSSTDVGSVCTYSCGAGYRLDGGSTRVCTQSGNDATQWSGSEPFCKVDLCESPLSSPADGNVSCSSGRDVGSYCTYSCSQGFYLKGGSISRACVLSENTASWSGSEPTCASIRCPSSLAPPVNGDVSCTDDRAPGSHCTYSCSVGYQLAGPTATRLCIHAGSTAIWTGSEPLCERIQCGSDVPTPENGNSNCDQGNDVESICTYTCDMRYKLTGSDTNTCILTGNTGMWNGSAPNCTLILCASSLEAPVNGTVLCTDNHESLSVCTYDCVDGFQLTNGTSKRTCELHGESASWSGSKPSCTPIRCSAALSSPANGNITCTGTKDLDASCIYSCNRGYLLTNGSTIRNCSLSINDTASWDGEEPTCSIIRCDNEPPTPDNGRMICTNGQEVGSNCSYTCKDGYQYVGESGSRVCTLTGSSAIWSGAAPVCTLIQCPSLPHPPNDGNVSCSNGPNVSSQCSYTCSYGYRLDGPKSRTCTRSGNTALWSQSGPKCRLIQCGTSPPKPEHGRVKCTEGRRVGSTCIYSCNVGHRLSNNATEATCVLSGRSARWNGSEAKCTVTVDGDTALVPTSRSTIDLNVTDSEEFTDFGTDFEIHHTSGTSSSIHAIVNHTQETHTLSTSHMNTTHTLDADDFSILNFLKEPQVIIYGASGLAGFILFLVLAKVVHGRCRQQDTDEVKYQVPRSLPMLPPKPDPMVACKDVDDEVQDFRDDASSQVPDNTYESIRELKSFRKAKPSSKPASEGAASSATDENIKAIPPTSETTPDLIADKPKGSYYDNVCDEPFTSHSVPQNYPSEDCKMEKTNPSMSHKRTVSVDVHHSLPVGRSNVGLTQGQESRQEYGNIIPGTNFEDTYEPLKGKSMITGSLSMGSPRTSLDKGSDDEDDHVYLIPGLEEQVPPMSSPPNIHGQNMPEHPIDHKYERAILRTLSTSRAETISQPSVSADQNYETITTGPEPSVGSYVFGSASGDPSQEQLYEDADSGVQPRGQQTQYGASSGSSAANEKALGSAQESPDNIYETPN